MTATVTDLAVRTLAGVLDLDVERTQYRGHARELAAATTADLVIVHGGDGRRAQGRRESVALFLRTLVHQYYAGTDRHRPALTVERDGEPPVSGLFMTIVTNRSPWTYLGDRPLLPVPNPDFNSGLDLL